MNDDIFSSIDFIGQCLFDQDRSNSFRKAIDEIVKKDNKVLDLGTGTGILALFAAEKGASVTSVEIDPFIASIARENFALNHHNEDISLSVEDARKSKFDQGTKFDVVVSEMLTTGMIDEHQVQAINNLHTSTAVNESTVFIPKRQDTFISVSNANFEIYNLKFLMTVHLWKWHNWDFLNIIKFTDDVLLNSINFNSVVDNNFKKVIEIKVNKSGVINSIYLSSKSVLTDSLSIGDTESLNAPMLIPVKEKEVKSGEIVKVRIDYIFGGSYSNFKVEFVD